MLLQIYKFKKLFCKKRKLKMRFSELTVEMKNENKCLTNCALMSKPACSNKSDGVRERGRGRSAEGKTDGTAEASNQIAKAHAQDSATKQPSPAASTMTRGRHLRKERHRYMSKCTNTAATCSLFRFLPFSPALSLSLSLSLSMYALETRSRASMY